MAIALLFTLFILSLMQHSFALQSISLNQLSIKLDNIKQIHHSDTIKIQLKILKDLVYDIPDGKLISHSHEIHFFQMGDIRIPCYVNDITFLITINDDTIAKTAPVSLHDLAASFQTVLPIEIFDHDLKTNGWILASSNEDECFDGKQHQYQSHYSGIQTITESYEEYMK
eukprot:102721_1